MSVEKILHKIIRGESDANIRFEDLCLTASCKGISDARFRQPSYVYAAGCY
jgi:hypothetical protein